MTAPEITRTDPPRIADERTMLDAWLDYHRTTLLMKCAGLDEEQLKRRSAEPSTLSLLGLVRHMTEVERGWFLDFGGVEYTPFYWSKDNYDGDFDHLDSAPVDRVFAAFDEACAGSREVVAGRSLDDTFTDEREREFSLRWIYIHMIEEYARHNGHADLIRERIDGAKGD